LTVRAHLVAPPDRGVAHQLAGRRWRPVFALLGLVLIALAALFSIASSSPVDRPDALLLFSCGACHD
jgi:hypothetical protein